MNILDSLQSTLKVQTLKTKFLVAYSGGLDSHVLLHLMSRIPNLQVRVMHIHHGLQVEADSWVNHCENICRDLKLPIDIVHLNLSLSKGDSIEERAREGRYKAFKRTLKSDEVLLTAHHQNDQAETLLLQLLRGSGVQGLASMPVITSFGSSELARPLLKESRQSVEAYAKENQLDYIEDPSNQDQSFDRNFLRQNIIPQLRARWKGVDKTLSRVASIQSETKGLLDEMAKQDLYLVLRKDNNTLLLKKLLMYSEARQKLLVRYWIASNGFLLPSEKKLSHIFSDVVYAQKDAQPLVEWGGGQLRRFNDALYLMSPLSEHDASLCLQWDGSDTLDIPSLGTSIKPEILMRGVRPTSVRFRQGGEMLYDKRKKKHISLKNYFYEASIPPWLRSRIPLVYDNEELVQVITSIYKK